MIGINKMVRQLRSYSTSAGVKKHPKDAARADHSNIRLRSGSAGQRPSSTIRDDDEHEPIEVRILKFSTKASCS